MKEYLDHHPTLVPLWTRHDGVLQFLSEHKMGMQVTMDSNFQKMLFDGCKKDMKVEQRVVMVQTAWADLVRVRAEALGFKDALTVTPAKERRCFNCGLSATKRCKQCHLIWYCGRPCQRMDQQRHKLMCVTSDVHAAAAAAAAVAAEAPAAAAPVEKKDDQ
jgi:hypothetical protein